MCKSFSGQHWDITNTVLAIYSLRCFLCYSTPHHVPQSILKVSGNAESINHTSLWETTFVMFYPSALPWEENNLVYLRFAWWSLIMSVFVIRNRNFRPCFESSSLVFCLKWNKMYYLFNVFPRLYITDFFKKK